MNFNLRRMERVAAALGHPEARYPAVHVAGTNGKGSVSVLVASVLQRAGFTVGLYTSPHLERMNERFRVNGAEISDEALARLTRRVQSRLAAARLARDPAFRGAPRLTQFEFLTALAFQHFADAGVDVAVVEVGLGGRLDATNVLPHRLVSVVTNIGLDHTDWLGDTVEKIAAEKAGILRPRVPVVTAAEGAALKVVRGAAARLCAPLDVVGPDVPAAPTALAGPHQRRNAAVAAAVCARLRRQGWAIADADIRHGFAAARWPGRFERFTTGTGQNRITWLLDGAHNAPAALALERTLAAEGIATADVVFGALRDKDARAMASLIAGRARRVWTAPVPSDRSDDPRRLARFDFWSDRASAAASLNDALAAARAASRGPVLVTGSLYLVGAARGWLRRAGGRTLLEDFK